MWGGLKCRGNSSFKMSSMKGLYFIVALLILISGEKASRIGCLLGRCVTSSSPDGDCPVYEGEVSLELCASFETPDEFPVKVLSFPASPRAVHCKNFLNNSGHQTHKILPNHGAFNYLIVFLRGPIPFPYLFYLPYIVGGNRPRAFNL